MASEASAQGPSELLELNTRSFSTSQLHAYWLPSSLARVPEGYPSEGMQYHATTLEGCCTHNKTDWPMRSHQPAVQDAKDDKHRGSAGADLGGGAPADAAWETKGSKGAQGKHPLAARHRQGDLVRSMPQPRCP